MTDYVDSKQNLIFKKEIWKIIQVTMNIEYAKIVETKHLIGAWVPLGSFWHVCRMCTQTSARVRVEPHMGDLLPWVSLAHAPCL